jgi:hypothetical protein
MTLWGGQNSTSFYAYFETVGFWLHALKMKLGKAHDRTFSKGSSAFVFQTLHEVMN